MYEKYSNRISGIFMWCNVGVLSKLLDQVPLIKSNNRPVRIVSLALNYSTYVSHNVRDSRSKLCNIGNNYIKSVNPEQKLNYSQEFERFLFKKDLISKINILNSFENKNIIITQYKYSSTF